MSNEESLQKAAGVQISAERIFMQRLEEIGKGANALNSVRVLAVSVLAAVVIAVAWFMKNEHAISDLKRGKEQSEARDAAHESAIRSLEFTTRHHGWEIEAIKDRIK